MRKRKWRAEEVVHALRVAYGVTASLLIQDEWSFLTEVPLRAPRVGYEDRGEGYWSNTRTIDVLMTRNWSSGVGHRRIAIEVKVTRSDYRNETDLKRAPAERAAHQTYYAAPAGVIDPLDLPEGWGLFEIHATREEWEAAPGWVVGSSEPRAGHEAAWVKCRVRAEQRTPQANLDYLVATGMRRGSRAEEKIRRGESDATRIPALEEQIKRLEGQLERRDYAVADARGRIKAYAETVAALEGGQVCSECRQPIVMDLRSAAQRSGVAWRHVDKAQDGPCEEARAETDRIAKEKAYGARYTRGWAQPIQPLALMDFEPLPD